LWRYLRQLLREVEDEDDVIRLMRSHPRRAPHRGIIQPFANRSPFGKLRATLSNVEGSLRLGFG
jgi:hypothetical protein